MSTRACPLRCTTGSGYSVLPLVGAAHHACGVYLLSLTQVSDKPKACGRIA
jgi:hypothetical protein